jgi:hypothetical protein
MEYQIGQISSNPYKKKMISKHKEKSSVITAKITPKNKRTDKQQQRTTIFQVADFLFECHRCVLILFSYFIKAINLEYLMAP